MKEQRNGTQRSENMSDNLKGSLEAVLTARSALLEPHTTTTHNASPLGNKMPPVAVINSSVIKVASP